MKNEYLDQKRIYNMNNFHLLSKDVFTFENIYKLNTIKK